MEFVTAYGPKRKVVIDASDKFGPGAKQSFREECDINNIMRKYQKTGALTWLAKHEPTFGDFTGFDFMEAQMIVAKAKEMFADLPSSVRERFAHDPAKFLEFMEDPANVDEAVKLGLAVKREPVVPAAELVVAPAAPADPPK